MTVQLTQELGSGLELKAFGDRPVVVSPHLDDAIWSCGSLLWQMTQAGQQPLVANVITDEPPNDLPLTTFAQCMHDKWGGTTTEVWQQRQSEDRDARAFLGVEGKNLGFLDAIYRGYVEESLLAGELDADDHLAPEIVAAVGDAWTDATVFLPLAIGGHVDHVMCFGLRTLLEPIAKQIFFYDDFPYVTQPGQEAARHDWLSEHSIEATPHHVALSEPALKAHGDASALYVSQIDGFFFPTRERLTAISSGCCPTASRRLASSASGSGRSPTEDLAVPRLTVPRRGGAALRRVSPALPRECHTRLR